jgi:hypothetical protein
MPVRGGGKNKGGWLRGALVLLLGSIIGTLVGQIAGSFLSPGPWRDAFLKGATVGMREPVKLDLSVLQLVLGLTLCVNPLTVAGFLLTALILVKLPR